MLRAFTEISEGRLFVAHEDDLAAPVVETANVVRKRAIETALVDSRGTRRILLDAKGGGLVDAVFDPPAGPSPSGGERMVLAIARAFASGEMDDRELAVVAYSEAVVDYLFRKSIWELVANQMPDMPHGILRTLIVVAEANIDVPLHCRSDSGFRFALTGSRVLRRRHSDDLNASANQIVVTGDPVVFFLGAGFSASSRLPLGNSLRDNAIRRLLVIPPTDVIPSEDLALRFHRWVSQRDWLTDHERAMREDAFARQLTLEQVIRAEKRHFRSLPTLEEFKTLHDTVISKPGQAVTDLAFVLQQMVGRAVIVEVNFDCLVERHATVPIRVFYSDEHFEEAADYIRRYLDGTEDAVPVLKLHGSIEEPDTCVVSDEQTQRGIGAGKLDALRALIEGGSRLWVNVGASMRDRDLNPVLHSPEFAWALEERWVLPYLDPAVDEFAAQRIPFWSETPLRSIEDRLITETADAFFAAVRRALT
jgi:hypothetical protein